ncbi:MAG: carboxylesterase family protein, partial [Gammaproteobacteria bacterium]
MLSRTTRLATVAIFLMLTSLPTAADVSQVNTQAGVYLGHGSDYADGVSTFKGIAFAAPPVGDLRWQPPAPPIPFAGEQQADRIGAACWQAQNSDATIYARGNLHRSEDCLYLNVFSGAASASDRLPVMVWFHGGGNTAGHAAPLIFDGSNLAARGAVIVTANYRLGPLGFLTHPALTAESPQQASGNYGLLDQIAALGWVQQNIAAFGGDPDRVTIFGQSAGGTDVCLLMASPLTEGMISGVIGQSPGCVKLDATLEDSGHDRGLAYADNLGVSGSNAAAVRALRAVPAETLIATSGGNIGPVIDGWVIPAAPYELLQSGRQNRIPVMVGGLSDEFHGLQHTAPPITEQQFDDYLEGAVGSAAATIKRNYQSSLARSALDARKDVMTDNGFLLDVRMWGRLVRERGNDAYVYFFSRSAPVFRIYTPDNADLTGNGGQRLYGAYHSGELAYVFDNTDLVGLDWDGADHRLAGIMADYWVNFARSGDPNGPGLPQWPVYNPDTDVVQILDSEVQAAVHPRKTRLDQLESLYLQSREAVFGNCDAARCTPSLIWHIVGKQPSPESQVVKCEFHPGAKAVTLCNSCSTPLCGICANYEDEVTLCERCLKIHAFTRSSVPARPARE